MTVRLTVVSLVLSLALVGAACTAAPVATPPEGPSRFLADFRLATVVASVNATVDGPRCLDAPPEMSSSHASRDSLFGGWTDARLTTPCSDPGDGTALAQAWAAGIEAELGRLGANVSMTGTGTTPTGTKITSEWEYLSSGLRGQITVGVLPAPEGRYWVIVRIFEPS